MKRVRSGARHGLLMVLLLSGTSGLAAEMTGPEATLRALVQANADKDVSTLARLMAHDADIVSYTIGGRKYVGWPQFEREMLEEFRTVTRVEIPIIALKVWTRGEVAWFAMELDYIRYIATDPERRQMVLPLRETGVLELRHGEWVLTAWHESFRAEAAPLALSVPVPCASGQQTGPAGPAVRMPDLSGEWEVQEEDKSYKAALDRHGNGLYSWQSGRIVTTVIAGQKWQGDRKSTRLNSSHSQISYAGFCLKKKKVYKCGSDP